MKKYYYQTNLSNDFEKPYEVCFTKTNSNGVLNDNFMEYDFSVLFLNMELGIMKLIVDSESKIVNFPGIKQADWQSKIKDSRYLTGLNEYGMSFKQEVNGDFIIIWTIQTEELVQLYVKVNKKGEYIGQFDLYYM